MWPGKGGEEASVMLPDGNGPHLSFAGEWLRAELCGMTRGTR